MTLESTGLSVDQVMAVRDRPLTESYEVHDVGMEILVGMLESQGFHCEDHGDDARHADEVLYGDGPDIAVYTGNACVLTDDPLCYIEVKTKESAEWFGRCNLRHFREYVSFAKDVDVPVFIWFAYLDSESGQLHRDAFFEVEDTDQIDGDVVDLQETELVFEHGDVKGEGSVSWVEADDIIEIRRNDVIVEDIPDVHGNEVIELDDKQFRSLSHVLNCIQS